jgi:ATP-dependent Lhr-like helicase
LFFARHGRFTAVQEQAIPPILDGRDTLVIAATATGKTEAVIAPLLERQWQRLNRPDHYGLGILYICPTRALVRDLYERLQPSLADSGVTMAIKTGDTGPLSAKRPPAILLTTPESTDSLLTREPRLFISAQAIVLDEIHLFDNTPRGDHVRCLLPRLERIRQYAAPEVSPAQRVALSATVPDPAGVARRYLQQGVIVHALGGRRLVAEVRPLYDLSEVAAALAQRAAQKSLLFCNTREEVEQTAAYLRRHLPHQAEVFVHYGNLDAQMRRDVETRFAAVAVAVCVCTSTLELGIDIGSVDDIVLLGAPYSPASFLQRVGRGGRRTAHMRVLCLPKSPGEWARFEALLTLANAQQGVEGAGGRAEVAGGRGQGAGGRAEVAGGEEQGADGKLRSQNVEDVQVYGFRPSVLAQQVFSLIKQSPTGSIRLADVRRIAPPEVTSEEIGQIVSHLAFTGYLQPGRLGEWKPDGKLQELLDRHEIYSNIGAELLTSTAVDAYTGNVIAQTNRTYEKGTVVLFGGKAMEVMWRDKQRFGLAPARRKDVDEVLPLRKVYAAIPFIVTQTVARSLGIGPGQMATLPGETGLWLYHFWGTVWGELLTAVLLAQSVSAEFVNEYCLYLRPAIGQFPPWDEALAQRVAARAGLTLANRLDMGRFHDLLPATVAIPAASRHFNLERFGQLYRAAAFVPGAGISEQLHMLRNP